MVPGVSLGAIARDAGAYPMPIVRIVNVPGVSAAEIALGTEDVLLGISRLVDVKLKSLRGCGRLCVVIQVVDEVRGACVRSKLFPPQRIGVGPAATDGE